MTKHLAGAAAPFPVERQPITPHGFRVDIQLLRALAVVLVVLHHARVPGISGGFLGVDIFFVISGYLMTGIIARELDDGRFRFSHFYARRVRRLLPAAYATLTLTAIAAPVLLDAYEYHDFLGQLAGSFGFFANFVLWKQADYFNTGAALKPLLHMWSLSVEEQYYIILPALLWLCPRRLRLPLSIVAVTASAALCYALLDRSPTAAFYLLPFRAWELGIGSVMALLVQGKWLKPRAMPLLRAMAGSFLLVEPFVADARHHPGLPALAACLATAILLRPGLDLRRTRLLSPIVAIGDRSYSLYLVHWPLFALANNVVLFETPASLNLALVVAGLIWMEIQYRVAERPFRSLHINMRSLAVLVGIPVLVMGASFSWKAGWGKPLDPARAYNFGLSNACDLHGPFAFQPACRTGAAPKILFWGDSFAMQLVGAGVASADVPIAQATRTVCAPFLDIAPYDGAGHPVGWGRRCIAFNDSVVKALASAPSVGTVVLSSSLSQYVAHAEAGWQVLERKGTGFDIHDQDDSELLTSLTRTVDALHRLGKRVVLVAPPPSVGYDIGRCHGRLAEGRWLSPSLSSCDFERADYLHFRAANLAFLSQVEARHIVPVFRFEQALCPHDMCQTVLDGTLLYRDSGHLSVPGSALLGRRLAFAQRLQAVAR